jgi:gliding motility-associated-like protein
VPANNKGNAATTSNETVIAQQETIYTEQAANANFIAKPASNNVLRFSFIPEFTSATKYLWNFGDGEVSNEINPLHTYTTEGIYEATLEVTLKNGTTASQTYEVVAERPADLLIPNIFTPNGDGINDVFEVKVINNSAVLTQIVIFNNSGVVFESDGSVLWNGQLPNGELAPAGSFVYLVKASGANNAIIEKTGNIYLRR